MNCSVDICIDIENSTICGFDPSANFSCGCITENCPTTEAPVETTTIDPCDANPCENGATCMNMGNGLFQCQCAANFYGVTCSMLLSTHLCDTTTCSGDPHAVCSHAADPHVEYSSNCADPSLDCFATTSRPETTTVNPCAEMPCENGATCIADGEFFECACADGFFGATCSLSLDNVACPTEVCNTSSTSMCPSSPFANYSCLYVIESCPTTEGLTTTLPPATTIDPCGNSPCLNGATCQNLGDGESKCLCAPTFHGKTCALQPGNILCDTSVCSGDPAAICTHKTEPFDNFACNCSSSLRSCFTEVSPTTMAMTVTTEDPCESITCENGGTCQSGEGSFTCLCAAGFYGTQCSLQHASVLCDAQVCTGDPDAVFPHAAAPYFDYSCQCSNPIQSCFTTESTTVAPATTEDPCGATPCRNGGTCLNLGGGEFECQCANTFHGRTCDLSPETLLCDTQVCTGDPTSICSHAASPYFDFDCNCADQRKIAIYPYFYNDKNTSNNKVKW